MPSAPGREAAALAPRTRSFERGAGSYTLSRRLTALTDSLDLRQMQLSTGEGRRFDLAVKLDDLHFGDDVYTVAPSPVPIRLELSRTTHSGYALKLNFEAALNGPCMRCLGPAAMPIAVEAREVDQPGGGEELESPYVDQDEVLDVAAWTRDALALAVPAQILCRPDCRGLCPECGIDLNTAPADHHHDRAPDPRWAKLSEIKFEE